MLPTFSVSISTIHCDPANQSFEGFVTPITTVSSLEAAFEKALSFHQVKTFPAPKSGVTERAIQIHERGKLIAMATVGADSLKWMKSPTVADAIEWSRSVKVNLDRIESQGLNAGCGQNEQPFAFKVLAHLISSAKEKLSSLYQPRCNDEVYATLKKVEDRFLSRSEAPSYSIFELTR